MASDSRYEVTASFSASGLVPKSRAMAGNDVAMTVEVHVFHEQRNGNDQRYDAVAGIGRHRRLLALGRAGLQPLQAVGRLLEFRI